MTPADTGPTSTQYQLAPASRKSGAASVSVPAVIETSSPVAPDAKPPGAPTRSAHLVKYAWASLRCSRNIPPAISTDPTMPATPQITANIGGQFTVNSLVPMYTTVAMPPPVNTVRAQR